jgi:nucleoside-diphosphate-sugar epimerase
MASDAFGPEVEHTVVGERFFRPILAGKTFAHVGDPDAPHSLTYVPDFARAVIELAGHEEAFGQVWHAPTAPAVSIRRFAELVTAAAGAEAPRVSHLSRQLLRLVGVFQPATGEVVEMLYEFEEPFLLDSSKIERAFGLTPTPFDVSIPVTVAWWQGRRAQVAART